MGSLSVAGQRTADAAAAVPASTPEIQLPAQDAARASPIRYGARRKRAFPGCWQYAFAPVRSPTAYHHERKGASPWAGSTTKSQ